MRDTPFLQDIYKTRLPPPRVQKNLRKGTDRIASLGSAQGVITGERPAVWTRSPAGRSAPVPGSGSGSGSGRYSFGYFQVSRLRYTSWPLEVTTASTAQSLTPARQTPGSSWSHPPCLGATCLTLAGSGRVDHLPSTIIETFISSTSMAFLPAFLRNTLP